MVDEKIYNLSTHYCDIEGVETEPRLKLLQNIKNSYEVIDKIKDAIDGVPKGAKVLLGGINQYVGVLIMLAKQMKWTVYYYDQQNEEVFTATFLSRQDKMEIEAIMIKNGRI